MNTIRHNFRAKSSIYTIGFAAGSVLLGLALVVASGQLTLGGKAPGLVTAVDAARLMLGHSSESRKLLSDRAAHPGPLSAGEVGRSARSEVLVAAFVPAPKHPPKVTIGTGSR
jgi:hypothetical protein